MNRNVLRDLLGAVLALSATAITTQTIVHAAPRPYFAGDELASAASAATPSPGRPSAAPASLALCAGRSGTVC